VVPALQAITKKRAILVLRYGLAALALGWVYYQIPAKSLRGAFEQTALWTAALFLGLLIIAMTLQGVRWWILLRAFAPDLSAARALYAHFVGQFYSVVLPSSAQDIVRTVLISRNIDYSVSWGATWVCRVLGIASLLACSLYGLASLFHSGPPKGLLILIVLIAGLMTALFAFSFSKALTRPFRSILRRLLPARIFGFADRIREGVYRFRTKSPALLVVFGVSVAIQALVAIASCFLIRGITGRFYFNECFAYIPLIEILSVGAALTPSGIGVRESLSALMFRQMGLPGEAIGVYVVFTLLSSLLKVIGGIPLLIRPLGRTRL